MSDNGLVTKLPKPLNPMAEAVQPRLELILRMLPPGIQPVSFAVACINEVNKLKPCDPASVCTTVYNAATVGLIPGSALGHCYFIPYKGRLSFVLGYRGMIELAMASDFLRDIHTDLILRDEKWRYWKDESGPRCEHEVPIDRPEPSRDNIIGAYCIYGARDGGKGICVLNRKQLNAVDSGEHVWSSDYAPMCQKTAIRRASKEWRLSYRLARAVELDEQFERGEEQEVSVEMLEPEKRLSLKDIVDVESVSS